MSVDLSEIDMVEGQIAALDFLLRTATLNRETLLCRKLLLERERAQLLARQPAERKPPEVYMTVRDDEVQEVAS